MAETYGENKRRPVFTTTYPHRNIDGKGRLAVPARYRAQIERLQGLEEPVYVFYQEFDHCITIFTCDMWFEMVQDKLDAIENEDMRLKMTNLAYSRVEEQFIDSQGRILLNSEFLKELDIGQVVTIQGNGKTIRVVDDRFSYEESDFGTEEERRRFMTSIQS